MRNDRKYTVCITETLQNFYYVEAKAFNSNEVNLVRKWVASLACLNIHNNSQRNCAFSLELHAFQPCSK